MRLTLVNCGLPSSTPNPHLAPPHLTRFPTLSSNSATHLARPSSTCWSQAVIPPQWKLAAIKLGKSSAAKDPTTPTNFRPIVLTSCVGKLFTTILKNRWLNYMTHNGYLSSSIQKAFMKATPGCIKHQCKLAAILAEARKNRKSLAVCLLDLANAYSSVHHSLIQFAICHYHSPPQFCNIIQSLCSDLHGTVVTDDWSTAAIPLELGVYQGEPLLVVIFNMVINTMVDTLQTRSESSDLGFLFPSGQPPAVCRRHLHHCQQPSSWSASPGHG